MPRRFREHVTARGIVTRSGFEAKVLADLDARGVAYEYEPYSYNWFERLPRARCACGEGGVFVERWYTPDVFLTPRLRGVGSEPEVYVEVKGKFTAKDRKIALGIKEAHPTVEIRFLFQRDNAITKGSTTRYTDWCAANGFTCHVSAEGVIPGSWT